MTMAWTSENCVDLDEVQFEFNIGAGRSRKLRVYVNRTGVFFKTYPESQDDTNYRVNGFALLGSEMDLINKAKQLFSERNSNE